MHWTPNIVSNHKNIDKCEQDDHQPFSSPGVMTVTTLVPSLNLVLNTRFAFWNMPSFKLTTINCDPVNLVLMIRPIF